MATLARPAVGGRPRAVRRLAPRRPGPGGHPGGARPPPPRTRGGRRARSRAAVHGPERGTDLGTDGGGDGVQLTAGVPAALHPPGRTLGRRLMTRDSATDL